MVKIIGDIPDELIKQVETVFPETVGMTRPALVKWALRKVLAQEVKAQ
jgi:metal-responsive CopG/Arc/MetJ family transcriptional regulator